MMLIRPIAIEHAIVVNCELEVAGPAYAAEERTVGKLGVQLNEGTHNDDARHRKQNPHVIPGHCLYSRLPLTTILLLTAKIASTVRPSFLIASRAAAWSELFLSPTAIASNPPIKMSERRCHRCQAQARGRLNLTLAQIPVKTYIGV